MASISSVLLEATDPTVPVDGHGFPISARLQEREETSPYRNVALIILESVRARSTTVHAPDLPTTPYLAELAKQSVVFEQAYTTVPRTSKALISILCGIHPHFAVAITEATPGGMPARCLAALFGERGFASAYFQSATQDFENRGALVANMGFDGFFPLESMSVDGFEEANYFGREDDVMLPVSKTWLQNRGDRPFVAAYLTVTSHHPYFAPSGRYGRLDLAADEELNRYLNTVRYQDFFVRNLIAQYKALGLYDQTLFVIVADHGEGFDEHGRNHHNTVIYEEGLRVLFMVHAPGRFAEGHRIKPLTSVLDVVPTVTDLLGYDVIDGQFPGRSMLDSSGARPVIASCFRVRACMSIRRGDYKLIHHFQNREDELFNVIEDPLEQHDLRAARPELATNLVEELEAFRLHMKARYARFHQERITQRLSASN